MRLSPRQQFRKDFIGKGLNRQMTNRQVASSPALSVRQVQRIKRRFLTLGDAVFVHGNTGRKPKKTLPNDKVDKIILIRKTVSDGKELFAGVNYSFFAEVLHEYHNLSVSVSSVRKILLRHGFKSSKRHRVKKEKIHYLRPRREHFGELVQADGTQFDWFGDGHKCVIQGFVDDATGIPVGLYMTKNECLLGYVEAVKRMLKNYDIPVSLYPDKAGIFFVNNPKAKKESITKFGR
jgi:transposase